MTRDRELRADSGSGSLLAVGVIGSTIAAVSLGVPLYTGLRIHAIVGRAADTSALAGADVASGLAPGSPCGIAASVAAANRVNLDACDVDGLVVTVRTGVSFLGIRLAASATAGPPVVVTN